MKIKIPSQRTESLMDPGRIALPSPLAKGSILLHEIRARVRYGCYQIQNKNKSPRKIEDICFSKRRPVVHTNPAFYSHYIKPTNLVNSNFADSFKC